MNKTHTFHIPVMGIAYTIDSPLKVAHLGIDSVVSLVDDILLEKLRKFYSEKFELPYNEISEKVADFRAKRITSYLDMMHNLAEKKLEEVQNIVQEKKNDLKEYFSLLPKNSQLKSEFQKVVNKYNIDELRNWLKSNLKLGSIDVNIMTKVDKDNFQNGEQLPVEFNDAHAALRGFANSKLESSVVLSAGMNPRLYSYINKFDDFFPKLNGFIKKKIVLKVSDFRSALIQGKFLAKKGIWVSEYRIESGLNCGGHAFATEGYLLGPILSEFKEKKEELKQSINSILKNALKDLKRVVPNQDLEVKISAQGGVGTSEEHDFLIDHYNVDSVGWGSPFLLVPEATTIDSETISLLERAKEEDLYLSNISPLGVPFNNLRFNSKDVEKDALIKSGKPGSSCPKKYVAINNEFTEQRICTASRMFQHNKLKSLNKEVLGEGKFLQEAEKATEKSCICVGLGTPALIVNGLDTKVEGSGVSVCPGPNMAYFNKQLKLNEMVDHIYGRSNVMNREDRPNMFVKEIDLYLKFFKSSINELKENIQEKKAKSLKTFSKNLNEGLSYYKNLFANIDQQFKFNKEQLLSEIEKRKNNFLKLDEELNELVK